MKNQNRYGFMLVCLTALIILCTFLIIGCKSKKEESVQRPQISGVKVEPVAVSTVDDIYEITGTVRSNQTS
ncbi:MAG TPA: hypothetical protein PLR10_12610, partial [Smithella sp.]|nr:hypothetical protein [Smithella sp.]